MNADSEGRAEVTALWRDRIPALSTDAVSEAQRRDEEASESRGALDGALSVGVREVASLPRGALFLEGVPVVVRVVGVPRRASTERLGGSGLSVES